MTTVKRKLDDSLNYDDHYDRRKPVPVMETAGCGAYTTAAIQYPLIGENGTLVKLLIGGVLTLVPVIGSWMVAGYALRAFKRVLRGDYALPEWDDFAGDFVNGLIVTIGLFVFGLLMAVSMALVVTIPVVIFFGFPMTAYIVARYAATDDLTSFVDIIGAYRAVFFRFGDAVLMMVGSLFVAIVMGILVGIGSIFLLIPGLMMAFALSLAMTFNAAVYGRTALNI
jgi:hypothetical protein